VLQRGSGGEGKEHFLEGELGHARSHRGMWITGGPGSVWIRRAAGMRVKRWFRGGKTGVGPAGLGSSLASPTIKEGKEDGKKKPTVELTIKEIFKKKKVVDMKNSNEL